MWPAMLNTLWQGRKPRYFHGAFTPFQWEYIALEWTPNLLTQGLKEDRQLADNKIASWGCMACS